MIRDIQQYNNQSSITESDIDMSSGLKTVDICVGMHGLEDRVKLAIHKAHLIFELSTNL